MEDTIGKPLSPYAVTKYELWADVFGKCYGVETIGMRYFNVFGPRQHLNSTYANVTKKWTGSLLQGKLVRKDRDGETSRDFCGDALVCRPVEWGAMVAAISGSFNIGA